MSSHNASQILNHAQDHTTPSTHRHRPTELDEQGVGNILCQQNAQHHRLASHGLRERRHVFFVLSRREMAFRSLAAECLTQAGTKMSRSSSINAQPLVLVVVCLSLLVLAASGTAEAHPSADQASDTAEGTNAFNRLKAQAHSGAVLSAAAPASGSARATHSHTNRFVFVVISLAHNSAMMTDRHFPTALWLL